MKDILFIIPARGGSKGIPKKNSRLLSGKPLINYSIEIAQHFSKDDICITTDDEEIINIVKATFNISVPFKRPDHLSSDTASSNDVLIHAINYYKSIGKEYQTIVLLQPTSPFRTVDNVKEAIELFNMSSLDMVVSVCESKSNPYYNLFEENKDGYLEKSKPSIFTRRQDCPNVYAYNGAVYVIRVSSLLSVGLTNFKKIKKVMMTEEESLDIDTPLDWKIAEFVISQKNGS